MIIVLGTAKLGDGALEAAHDAFSAMVAASRAEEGVLHYAFSVDVLDPGVMHISEKYVDQQALALHGRSDHMAAFQKALSGLDVTITELSMFNADDGTRLM